MLSAEQSQDRKAPRTHTDKLRRRLADEIISGTLRPGVHLDEKALAARFKVSRTPVREALRQLAASDLVEWRPHQGAIVATITIPKMIEMFEVMAELEGFCGRLAARRMNESERDDLLLRHRKCEPFIKSADKEGYLAMNKPFHEAIYNGAHNSYLGDHAQSLYNRLVPYRAYQLNRPGQLARSFEEHRDITQAIVGGEAEAAYRLLREHVTLDGELFRDLIASLNG
jgi:DNA-binding GntR family transcriptional regulator